MRRHQKLFRRDAAAQSAGAAEPLVFFDNCHFQTQLSGANRRHITARPAADYRHIELFVSQFGRFLSKAVAKWRKLLTCVFAT
jgi:hypothetical protein